MPDQNGLLHAIVNGGPEFERHYGELMKGLGSDITHDLEPVDFNNPQQAAGVHQTLKAILEHLQKAGPAAPKTVQVIRDPGGRMVGAKVITPQ